MALLMETGFLINVWDDIVNDIMTEEGKYIYCIIGETQEKSFGLPCKKPEAFFRGYTGINNQEIRLISYKDISAVVSSTPIINFDRLNKKELTTYVAIHQKVQEAVMREFDVVPMTFGVIAPSHDEVMRILEKVYLQFKTALKNIAGKAEFATQIWWDPKKLLEELANTNPEIQKLKQEVSSKGSILGMPIKLKLGRLIQKEAEIQRQTFINDIHASLRNLSFDSTSNKLIDDACPVGSRSDSFGEMIANLSFLIEKTRESELDKKMQELGKKYEGKLGFKYIGPMPPYSFVNINLSLGNFELVDEARNLLGLPEEVTFDEIKKIYHTLAHQYHPDKFQGDPKEEKQMEKQMKKIAHAYGILENYCQSCDELMGKVENRKYSFKEEEVKNSLIIK